MGIQNIIKNPQEEAPSSDSFVENGPFFVETEPPVIVDIYSDGSDTESFSELLDADDLLDVQINWITEEDQHLRTPSPGTPLTEETNESRNDTNMIAYTHSPSTQNISEKKHAHRTKNLSVKSRRSGMGKKKARRFENARQLALLAEEDCTNYDDNDFMSSECPFRFSQILEDTDLTNKILNSTFDDVEEFYFGSDLVKYSEKKKTEEPSRSRTLSPAEAFNNLDQSQKSFFRRRNLPMGMIQYLDTCVFSFFENNPTGTFISEPLTSFERMMLHSIAHYYDLNSYSFDAEDRVVRLTKVTNSLNYFKPPFLCLSQYLEEHVWKNLTSPPSKRRRYKRELMN